MSPDGVVQAYVLSADGATPAAFLVTDGAAVNLEPIKFMPGDLLALCGAVLDLPNLEADAWSAG